MSDKKPDENPKPRRPERPQCPPVTEAQRKEVRDMLGEEFIANHRMFDPKNIRTGYLEDGEPGYLMAGSPINRALA